jgi:hypothetical protein
MTDRNLLLVEGKDDVHVFYHLLKHHRIPRQFQIKDKGGIENLLGTLSIELKGSDLERLGVVVDADLDIQARWQALRNVFVKSGGVDIPTRPDPGGVVFSVEQAERRLVVGVWVMPDNALPGMLEDFVRFLVPGDDSLWDRAADCLARIPEQERHFAAEHQIKAHLHTWLAWQEDPGTPLGLAITRRYLDADASHARQLMDWVCRLFGIRKGDLASIDIADDKG